MVIDVYKVFYIFMPMNHLTIIYVLVTQPDHMRNSIVIGNTRDIRDIRN